jgi:hypothetical protein
MRYFGFISVDEISEVYQTYAKEQEVFKRDSSKAVEAQNRINAAFEIWTRILADKK